MLAERTHRLRHTVWHTLRGQWQSEKMTEDDRVGFKKFGWYLNDPPFKPENRTLDLTNGAGEDFLHAPPHDPLLHEVYDKAG